MSDAAPLTPLAHRRAVAAGPASVVAISEIAGRAMIDIRARREDEGAVGAIESALGFALPESSRTSTGEAGRAALWLSPDQWLVTAPLVERAALMTTLGETASGHFAAITDMSDARAIIRLAGAGAREVIMKGAAGDLTTPAYHAGAVRRVQFAGIAAMVHIVADAPDVIDVYVFRSYADYAWQWIATAARPAAALALFAAQPAPPV